MPGKKNIKEGYAILLTGGSGFLGKAIVRELMKENALIPVKELRILDLHKDIRSNDERISYIQGDVRDEEIVDTVTKGIDLVIHSAAIVDWGTKSKEEVVSVNFTGTKILLESARKNGIRAFVYTSSLVDMAKGGFYVRLGNGTTKSQHVYVGNVAYAHLQLSAALLNNNEAVPGNCYFITDGPGTNFFTFFDSIVEASGYLIRPENLWLPKRLALVIGTISEVIALVVRPVKYYNPKMSRFAVKYTCTDYTFSSCKAIRDFGFYPYYSREEAWEKTIDYWKKKIPVHSDESHGTKSKRVD